MKVPGPGIPWRWILLAIALLALGFGVFWSVKYYQTHSMPRVSLAGTPVGMMKLEQINDTAAAQSAKLSVEIKTEKGTKRPTLAEIGVTLDAKASVRSAFEARRLDDAPQSLALWDERKLPLDLRVDKDKLQDYLRRHAGDDYVPPTEPTLRYQPDINEFVLVPGSVGRGFNTDDMIRQLQQAAYAPRHMVFETTDEPVQPSVPDSAVGVTQDKANRQLLLRLNYLYDDKLLYYPEQTELASWLRFAVDPSKGLLAIQYDKARIKQMLQDNIGASIDSFLNQDATDESLRLTNVDALVNDAVGALEAEKSFEKEVNVTSVKQNSGLTE